MIEILVLLALAHQTQGDIATAVVLLERALGLAEPEGYVRIFVDEGMPMVALLQEAATRGIMPEYVGELLAAFRADEEERQNPAYLPSSSTPTGPVASTPLLVEPLSERELDVLRLLRTEMSGPEVASELMVSLSTMRTHTRNIYNKLGVGTRRAAVRRAEELHLL